MSVQHNLRPVPRPAEAFAESSIGVFLVKSGMLTAEDAQRVVKLQKEENVRFGEAAIRLGLLGESELRYALSRQFNYAYPLPTGDKLFSEELVAAFEPFDSQAEQFRAIRSQILLGQRASGGSKQLRLAIVGPSHHEGRSYLAANLAIVFAQMGERTLLIDADLRTPRQHAMFGLENPYGLSSLLAGRSGGGVVTPLQSLDNLDVLPAGPIPPNPLELLSQSGLAELLAQVSENYGTVLVDTSAFGDGADANMVAAGTGSALVVARSNFTRMDAFETMVGMLRRSHVSVIGSVLNEWAMAA